MSDTGTTARGPATPGPPGQPGPPGRRPRRGPRTSAVDESEPQVTRTARVLRYLSPVVLVVAWQLAAQNSDTILFPSPVEVGEALWDITSSGELAEVLWRSNQALLIGVAGALLAGIPVGILLGRSRMMNRILGVYVDIDLASPTIAFVPIVIIVFGLDLTARSVVVFLFAFSLVVSLVRTGARTVDPALVDMADAFAPTRRQLWTKVIIPGLLPALGGAFRVAVSRGVVGMVIVELTLTTVGIGGLIMEARSFFRAEVVYAGVIVVVAEGLLLMALGRWVERRIAPQGLYGTGG